MIAMKILPPEIFKHWIHSREEDSDGKLIYRPEGYKFPLARGRTGFEIKEDGEFICYDIGPDDRSKKMTGHWWIEDSNKVQVEFEDKIHEPFMIEILSVENEILVVYVHN